MLLVHAGNRVDDTGSGVARFPERQVAAVASRLDRFIATLRPRAVVSAAAAGADLLLLEAALKHGAEAHVVLPFTVERFREESVADRGGVWLDRFDRVIAAVRDRPGCSLVTHAQPVDEAGYRRGNDLLLEHGVAIAAGDGVLALAVRPRPARSSRSAAVDGSVTDDFVDRAQQRGLAVIDIDPGVRLADRPTAFVVMPFGEKTIGSRTVDCDETFRRLIVPLLEDADLAWERADRQTGTGIVHVGLIERLGNADVVVVDTIGDSPNVFYELGMRHALADKVTLLLGPQGMAPPFDTRPVRHFAYRLGGARLEEDAALDALRDLQPVLGDALRRAQQDSPVYYFFDRRPERLRTRDELQPRLVGRLHEELVRARDLRDGEALDRLADRVRDEPLHPEDRRQLQLLAGMAYRESGDYAAAVDLLDAVSFRSSESAYSLWVQQLALALRRRGERAEEAGEDPEPSWRRAHHLLHGLLQVVGSDAETCGIAAGLAKQRARRALERDQRAVAGVHLEEAARLYEAGAAAAPADYYTTLNAATTLRLLAQRFRLDDGRLARSRRLLLVAEFFAERASGDRAGDFWAAVSLAECTLTRHLLEAGPDADEVVLAYTRAALRSPHADALRSVGHQLRLYRLAGDPAEVLGRVEEALGCV